MQEAYLNNPMQFGGLTWWRQGLELGAHPSQWLPMRLLSLGMIKSLYVQVSLH